MGNRDSIPGRCR